MWALGAPSQGAASTQAPPPTYRAPQPPPTVHPSPPPTVSDRFFLGCCWAGGCWAWGATMATGGVWAAGAAAGGVAGVRGEGGAAGGGAAGLGPLLYRGARCLNCAGSAGLGAPGSSGGRLACRLASREDGAASRAEPTEARDPPLCVQPEREVDARWSTARPGPASCPQGEPQVPGKGGGPLTWRRLGAGDIGRGRDHAGRRRQVARGGQSGLAVQRPEFLEDRGHVAPRRALGPDPSGQDPSLEPPRGLGAWPGGPVWSGTPAPLQTSHL